jgi:hypothetical protein
MLNHGLVPVSVTDFPESAIGPFACPSGYYTEKAIGKWPSKSCFDLRSEFLLCCPAEAPTCVIRQQTDVCVR